MKPFLQATLAMTILLCTLLFGLWVGAGVQYEKTKEWKSLTLVCVDELIECKDLLNQCTLGTSL